MRRPNFACAFPRLLVTTTTLVVSAFAGCQCATPPAKPPAAGCVLDVDCGAEQLCQAGACVADPNAQVGGTSGIGGQGIGGDLVIVIPDPGTTGGKGSVDGAGKAGSSNGGTQVLSSGDDTGDVAAKGCGCSVPGGGNSGRALLGLALLGAWRWRRRRQAA